MNIEQLIIELAGEVRTLRKEVIQLQRQLSDERLKERYMSMKDACLFLHISRSTIHKRMATGEIDFAVKNGKSWLFPFDKIKIYASGLN